MEDDPLKKPIDVEESTSIDSKDLVAADQNPTCSQESKKELEFSKDEETLIIRMHNLVGERWPLIAGRIPGRSAEEIEKYWNSRQATSAPKLDLGC
ncbi:hypothetical protein ACS0TY_030287 [Phlomoides rotata]